MALTQGVLARMVADSAPEHLRGTSFGAFYFVSGVGTLLASIAAGLLWDRDGASATFIASAVIAARCGRNADVAAGTANRQRVNFSPFSALSSSSCEKLKSGFIRSCCCLRPATILVRPSASAQCIGPPR